MLSLLRGVSAFKECPTHELHSFSKICERILLGRGETIFEAGSPADYLYIVVDGEVGLFFRVTHYFASRKIPIDRIKPGEIFGWSALIEPHVYTLSAMAMRDSELLKVKKLEIESVCTANTYLGYVLMKHIATVIGGRLSLVRKILIEEIQNSLDKKEI